MVYNSLRQARLDNDAHALETVRLGPSTGLDTSTRGTCFLDAFVSRRTLNGPLVIGNTGIGIDALHATEAAGTSLADTAREMGQSAPILYLPLVIQAILGEMRP